MDMEVAGQVGHATALFRVPSLQAMPEGECLAASRAAAELVARPGMTCCELIEAFDPPA
jgi:hypothetical protein